MARRVLVREQQQTVELVECDADDEAELQNVLRNAPNLIPVDDLGLDGPMMVIGRETALPSGATDLLGITPTGALLVIEFKTGPNNPDYRHALAQLLDYGADLWRMGMDEFDTTVTASYLGTERCPIDDPARGAETVHDAARLTWPHLDKEQLAALTQRVEARLADGGFHFVLVAQRITPNSRSTIEYLHRTHSTGSFHAVELVKFADSANDTIAYEGRAVTQATKPSQQRKRGGRGSPDTVLDEIQKPEHREALEDLIEYCRGLQLSLEVGAVGFSIRLDVPERMEPVTLGWMFPPGATGWLGLRDLNLGYDTSVVPELSVAPHFDVYARRLGRIDGVEQVRTKTLEAVHVPLETLLNSQNNITDAIGELVAAIGEAG
jgi:hypothetical protein